MNKPSLALVGVAFTALILVGCTPGGAPSGAGSPTPGPTPTVTSAPTGSPSPDTAAEPDFGFTFFHGAQLGDGWDQMSSALGHAVGPEPACYYPYGPLETSGDVVTMASWDHEISSGVTIFYTFFLRNDATGPFPRNAEGVGVGSTRAEVLAAYPEAVVDISTPVGEAPVTRIRVGDPDSDSEYAFGISGYAGADVVDKLQWGTTGAGGVWEHLCGGS